MATDSFTRKDAGELDPFAGVETGRTAPVTPEQDELWLSVKLHGEPANLANNHALALRLEGNLDAGALRDALDELVERHEALRTTLSEDGKKLCISPRRRLALLEQDLSAHSKSTREQGVVNACESVVTTPFDLVQGPLIKAVLLHLDACTHVLILCAHRMVQDRCSASLLMDELGELYSAFRRGVAPALPAASAFGEYARQRAEESGSEAAARDLEFWRGRLQELPASLDLPLDHPRPALRSFGSDRVSLPIDQDLFARLEEIAMARDVDLATLLFAAFQAFIARISGQRSFAIVMPLADQSLVGYPALVGNSSRNIPFCCEIDQEEPFADHLRRVKGALQSALEHPRVTFTGLVSELSLARDPSRIPLSSIAFDVEPAAPPRFHELTASLESLPRRYEIFELFVNVRVSGSTALLEAQFNTSLFERSSVERRLLEYCALLEDIATDPQRPVGDLAVLTEKERADLSAATHAARTESPTETLCALFRDNAVKSPGTTAVSAGGRTFSYSELDRASAALAQELVARGIGPGSLVGVVCSRSAELLVALLGILRSGAAYVSLGPESPRERLEFIVNDARIRAVVTEQALADFVPRGPRCFIVDASREDATSDLDNSRLEDPAYVTYTSGAGDHPDGVVVEHRNLSNLLLAMSKRPGFGSSDVMLAVSPSACDISVPELFLPLVVGGKVVIASHDDVMDGRRLGALICSSGATLLQTTPATWRLLYDAGWDGEPRLTALVRGERLDNELFPWLLPRCKRLLYCYGKSEASVWSTMEEVRNDPTTIGRPIENTSAYVLDGRRRLVPPGVIGELYLGGAGVARGYLDRGPLTSERFVPDPFVSEPGARMVKTGDLARFTWDGKLERLGRADSQALVRGHRVELWELEARLAECSGVREAVAVVHEDAEGHQRIVAYVTPAPGTDPSEPELRADLCRRLPSYMIPRQFVTLECLPRAPTGEIDRRALSAPESKASLEYREPATEVEREIAGTMCALLSVNRVGRDDDFFALGGHSMSALRLTARIHALCGIDVPLRLVFASPTLQKIASFVEAALLLQRGSGVRVVSPGTDREEVLL